MKRFAILALGLGLGLAGCQSGDMYMTPPPPYEPGQGAISGAPAESPPPAARRPAPVSGPVGKLASRQVGHYMDNQESDLRRALRASGVSVRRLGNEIVLVMGDTTLFRPNSLHISSQALRTIDALSGVLNQYDRTLINVNGYTDTTGAPDYNLKLSRKRAEAVADVLVDDGVNPRRISPRGFGETHLAVPTGDNVDEPRNRRVEIHIVPHTASS